MRTSLVKFAAAVVLVAFVTTSAASPPAGGSSGGGSSAGASSGGGGGGGSYSGGGGGGGGGARGGGGYGGGGSYGGGGAAHGGGGGSYGGGGSHSGSGGGGGTARGGAGISPSGGRYGGGTGDSGSGGYRGEVRGGLAGYGDHGSFTREGTRGSYTVLSAETAGLGHAGVTPPDGHVAVGALPVGPRTGSAAVAVVARVALRPPVHPPLRPLRPQMQERRACYRSWWCVSQPESLPEDSCPPQSLIPDALHVQFPGCAGDLRFVPRPPPRGRKTPKPLTPPADHS